MGRYPVDVTTMLVGLHVAAAISQAILVAIIRRRSNLAYLQFDSAAVWSGGQSLAPFHLRVCAFPDGFRSPLVCCRDVHAVRVWAGSGTLSWAAVPTLAFTWFCSCYPRWC